MQIFKLEKQGTIAGVGYQAGLAGPQEAEKPIYFQSVESAQKHLVAMLGVLPQNMGSEDYRIYNSHMGIFYLVPIEVLP